MWAGPWGIPIEFRGRLVGHQEDEAIVGEFHDADIQRRRIQQALQDGLALGLLGFRAPTIGDVRRIAEEVSRAAPAVVDDRSAARAPSDFAGWPHDAELGRVGAALLVGVSGVPPESLPVAWMDKGPHGLDGWRRFLRREAEYLPLRGVPGRAAGGEIVFEGAETPGVHGEPQAFGEVAILVFQTPSFGDVLQGAHIADGPWSVGGVHEDRMSVGDDPADLAVGPHDAVLVGRRVPYRGVESPPHLGFGLRPVVGMRRRRHRVESDRLLAREAADLAGERRIDEAVVRKVPVPNADAGRLKGQAEPFLRRLRRRALFRSTLSPHGNGLLFPHDRVAPPQLRRSGPSCLGPCAARPTKY